MKQEFKSALRSFFFEFLVYSALVTGYFFSVLHLLGGWLMTLYQQERRLYAALALLLIIGQGLLLEVVTRLLLGRIKPRTEEG